MRSVERPNGHRRPCVALSLLVLAALVSLTPIASASPPDPSWIPGIYDAGDFDDVVVLVTTGDSAGTNTSPLHACLRLIAGRSQEKPFELVRSISRSSFGPRSPPTS